jgi:ribonuclease HII
MGKLLPFLEDNRIEAGCDEAGRGCLAGPVVAAAVILPNDFHHEWLNDSKQLPEKKRDRLREVIEKEALSFSVTLIPEKTIDEINILNASILAMHQCVEKLVITPEFLLIDGNRFHPFPGIKHECMIKGDGRFMSIAAASILAKTYRDEYMFHLHEQYPQYQWNQNKGYPTIAHREAIRRYGSTEHHRQSFTLLPPEQLSLFG